MHLCKENGYLCNTIVDILARLEGNKMPCQKQLPKGQKTLNDASKVQISDITPALFEDVTMVHIEGTLAKNHVVSSP